jgi:hypothetical protein
MLKLSLQAGALIALALPALADGSVLTADGVKWGAAPAVLPKGVQLAVIAGDPSKDGPYVVRLKMPANYRIPAHNHPTAENVISRATSTLAWATSSTPPRGRN